METALTIISIATLLFLSAAFSGLNIGLMMARPEELKRLMRRGDKVAEKVYGYRKNGNYFIVNVLLGNVTVNTTLSLVLGGTISTGVLAGVIATMLITAFGEILPQSVFSQRGWRLTRYFFWLLDIIFVVFWPIVRPISMLLDRYVGKEPPQLYSQEDFKEMIVEQVHRDGSPIDYEEGLIVSGALDFSRMIVGDEMTPLSKVFTINENEILDRTLQLMIRKRGHSRIPVLDDDGEFVGLLYIKDLLGKEMDKPVSFYARDKIHDIQIDTPLDTALKRFIQTKSHIFLVFDDDDQPVGILTLEDVIETIIRREIDDEHDGQ